MTEEEKLRDVIRASMKRGFGDENKDLWWLSTWLMDGMYKFEESTLKWRNTDAGRQWEAHLNEVIFSRPFLKAFFGEEPKYIAEFICHADEPSHTDTIDYWQYHAQQLVLSENRIDYLYQFVK